MEPLKHIISVADFNRDFVDRIFQRAKYYKEIMSGGFKVPKPIDMLMYSFFYEPSTRTYISFSTAAANLGITTVAAENAISFSSATKGESVEDTIHVLCEYKPNVIVFRHKMDGSAEKAVIVADKYGIPIINAGDGSKEHPTQALLDLFTIVNLKGMSERLTVVICGDLARGRTAKSLAKILCLYPEMVSHIIFISPAGFQIDDLTQSYLRERNMKFSISNAIKDIKHADVIYMTRAQHERPKEDGIEMTKEIIRYNTEHYSLNPETIKLVKKDAIILHPLPRNEEISPEINDDPRLRFFEQAGNGIWVRMATLNNYYCK
jgi:aspartate carbamoyltransferase catalytic subunit